MQSKNNSPQNWIRAPDISHNCFSTLEENWKSQKDGHLKCIPFLYRLITCDEKWILFDNSKRTGQWLDAGELPKHYPEPQLHPKNLMVTVWWSTKGVIHY
ncbi:Hypothetical predicted protein [Octopus vulgaris]|uniref:Histone-lysine N-methyltransferase SETMAR-like n=1 Tax=Octopus vulgaris TaxID=6645 RepID=A0AA36F256_OCTVU|nr:Hypothetical predicted protein [Octopus vulgaris]